jgi:hypothetical protein
MLIVVIIQNRTIKRLTGRLEEINKKGWKEVEGIGKVYRSRYIFVNIENAGYNNTLNSLAENYYNNGFDLDREKSTDRLLVFVKREEVKEDKT